MEESKTFTYRARLPANDAQLEMLDQCAFLFSTVVRKLFAYIASGETIRSAKNFYLKKYGITGRQFNACRISLEGKMASIKALQPLQISDLSERMDSLSRTIKRLQKKKAKAPLLVQKQRRYHRLQNKLARLKGDRANNKVRICFGGKKLFRSQFHLSENGFENHQEWKGQWQGKRNCEFLLVGSKDETAGNQSCVMIQQEDGLFHLRLRLPPALVEGADKYLTFSNIAFGYGAPVIRASLDACEERRQAQRENKACYKDLGQALTYRLKRDKKGWQVFVTTEMQAPARVTKRELGAIGVDINADHLAITEIDRFGNMLEYKTVPLNLYGASQNQAKALIGDAAAQAVSWSQEKQKPLVLEALDFQKKKATLKEAGQAKQARMLSSFSYQMILQTIKARAFRFGSEVIQVNPAFTSVIGRMKFAKKYGLSIHHAAAFCIARRLYGFSEKPSRSSEEIPDGKEGHVVLPLPVRNRGDHIWRFWGRCSKKLRAVLAAHFRAIRNRSLDPPLPILEIGSSRELLV